MVCGGPAVDLRTELPDLVVVLGLSIGPVRRVVYDPSIWPDAPSRIIRGNAVTAVDPYTLVASDTIYLQGTHSRDAVLYIVPPTVPGRRSSPTSRGVRRAPIDEGDVAAAAGGPFRGKPTR